ncbi:hypothetical protein KKH39_02875 [Patescibacteria group bacterium]|nr:hypothetical protein [Patescibacteria group bacterium]
MNLSTLLLLLVYIVNVGLLVYVLFSKNKKKGWPFFWMLLLLILWQSTELFSIIYFVDKGETLLLFAVRAGLLPTLYLAPAFLWLVFSLFDKWQTFKPWRKFLYFLPAIIMSPFAFTDFNTSQVVFEDERIYYVGGPIYWFFAAYFIILMSYGMYFLIKNRKQAKAIVRRQIDYIFIGTFLTAACGLIFNILLPIFGLNNLYYLGVNSTIFFTAILTYALFRYRFFDLYISFYRLLIDFVRLFFTGLIFYILYILLFDVADLDFSVTSNVLLFLVMIALVGPFLFRLINKFFVAYLVYPENDIKNSENKIADILRSSRDLDVLFSRLAREISKIVDYQDIYFFLSKRKNVDMFYQVFPVGERLMSKTNSEMLSYLARKREVINKAELEYIGAEKSLLSELSEKQVDLVLPIFYNRQLLGAILINNNNGLVSIQKIHFLKQLNKYLDIAIGSLLLHQQDMAENSPKV